MEYVLTDTIETKSGTTRVYRPVLTEEQRAKRQQDLYEAARRFLQENEKEQMRRDEQRKTVG